MKNWSLFMWALTRLKIENDNIAKCFRNSCLMRLMNLSGVKPTDVVRAFSSKKLT